MDFERRDEGDAFGFTYDDDKKVKKVAVPKKKRKKRRIKESQSLRKRNNIFLFMARNQSK